MKTINYVVVARRFGLKDTHAYVVCVKSKKKAAQDAADAEETHRGGNYICEILECIVDSNEPIKIHREAKPIEGFK